MNEDFELVLEAFSAPSDGSLPDIEITFPDDVIAQRAAYFILDEQTKAYPETLGHRIEYSPPLAIVEDKGGYERSFLSSSYLFMLDDFRGMPKIGFRVTCDEILLHFRTGPEWRRECVEALLLLMKAFVYDFQATVSLDPMQEAFGNQTAEAFGRAVAMKQIPSAPLR